MALSHKLSDAIRLHLEDDGPFPVIEIEFNFVRYRLTIDNEERAVKLLELLQRALVKREGGRVEDVRIPRFYKRSGGAQP